MGLQGREQKEPLLLRPWLAAPAEVPALLPELVRLVGAWQALGVGRVLAAASYKPGGQQPRSVLGDGGSRLRAVSSEAVGSRGWQGVSASACPFGSTLRNDAMQIADHEEPLLPPPAPPLPCLLPLPAPVSLCVGPAATLAPAHPNMVPAVEVPSHRWVSVAAAPSCLPACLCFASLALPLQHPLASLSRPSASLATH